ncbi:hypothetical protein ACWFRF_17475 [Nocardia sp. NPDC055165]
MAGGFLASTIVVAGFIYRYLLVVRGTDPFLARAVVSDIAERVSPFYARPVLGRR